MKPIVVIIEARFDNKVVIIWSMTSAPDVDIFIVETCVENDKILV